ncbi:MAG: hypothetical protein LLG04_14895 [Parachlamydia sp.]|nr:hypothetical protein [Parachlamydia sp.]
MRYLHTPFLLLAIICLTFMSAEARHPRRPSHSPEQKKRALEKLKQHQEDRKNATDEVTRPDPAFHGWWKSVTRGDLGGFGFNAQTDDIDVYIFIDTSQFSTQNPLVTICTLCGTKDYPRICTPLDVGEGIALNHFYVPRSRELVHVHDKHGPLFDPTLGQSFWSLKLQPDGHTICASSDSRPEYEGYGATSVIFHKVEEMEAVGDLNCTFGTSDPVEMAQYIRNALLLHYNQAQNAHLKDADYLPYADAEALFQKMIEEGLTFETKIRRIRVSRPGTHDRQEFGDFTSTDLLTDIFTDEFSFATAGSTVVIKGFEGPWEKLNGTYVNGVAIDEEGGIPNPSKDHVDASSSIDPKKGSFHNIYNHFLLDFDSSNEKQFPRDALGWAKEVAGTPVVTVRHHFTSSMEYPAFFAAIRAMFFLLYKVSQHNAHVAFFKPGSMFLIDSWKELQEAIAKDQYWGSSKFPGYNMIGTRTCQKVPSGFYNNPVLAERGVATYNDPFGLTQTPGSLFDYNIVMANYIAKPRNLYWAISGTPTGPYQFDPVSVGYKPCIPGKQPAEFVGTLGNLSVVDGKPQPHNPDPAYYTLYGAMVGTDDVRDSNSYYYGLIQTSLTGGKRVGYLRWLDEEAQDPSLYLPTAAFPPQVPVTAKYGREALSQVYSSITKYFQTELDCDSLIIDIRSYNGGYGFSYTLAEFFGDDRTACKYLWTKKGNENSEPLDLADSSRFAFFNDVAAIDTISNSTLFVKQNEQNYGPGAVFRGTPERPKKVIILTDNTACSAGDAFSHYFLGERLDGELGSHTTCRIIGDIDGRLKGAASFYNPLPVCLHSSFLLDSKGKPFSPIYFRADFACGMQINGKTAIPFNRQSVFISPSRAPTLSGEAGGAPLINDWRQTVWRDIGLIQAPKGHFSPSIPLGKPRFADRTTWRDCWLEQAILEATSSALAIKPGGHL